MLILLHMGFISMFRLMMFNALQYVEVSLIFLIESFAYVGRFAFQGLPVIQVPMRDCVRRAMRFTPCLHQGNAEPNDLMLV